jgi:TfoX C-terminal domain
MVMFGRFEVGRLIAAALLGIYGVVLVFSRDAVMQSWLHNVGLAIHEGGHYFVFALAPEFLMILGGSLTQCVLPMLFVFQFWRTGQQFATFATLFWVGYNLLDTAIYIADARARALPLLFGEDSIHDWHYILSALNMLSLDGFFGALTWGFGSLCIAVSVLGCVWFAQGDLTPLPWQMPKDPEKLPVSSLPNLGAKSAKLLAQIGIHTKADLDQFGALEAYQSLLEQQLTKPSRSLLLSLYGAVTNQEWQKINRVDKEKLLRKAGLLE